MLLHVCVPMGHGPEEKGKTDNALKRGEFLEWCSWEGGGLWDLGYEWSSFKDKQRKWLFWYRCMLLCRHGDGSLW